MLENVPESTKRYAPPSQRNRVATRKKSGGVGVLMHKNLSLLFYLLYFLGESVQTSLNRLERESITYGNDGDKNQSSYLRNFPFMESGEPGNINFRHENPNSTTIALDGCCSSEAARLLNERWLAAINSFNDPLIDLSERPMMYSGASGSSWGHPKLPHQMDFLAELRRSIHYANAAVVPPAVERNPF